MPDPHDALFEAAFGEPVHAAGEPRAFIRCAGIAPVLAAPARLALGEVHPTTKHACVEAADECTIDEFQARIASTRPAWSPAPPPNPPVVSGAPHAGNGP